MKPYLPGCIDAAESGTQRPVTVAVVGLGQAGARFVRACMVLCSEARPVRIVAGVDVSSERLRYIEERLPFPCFESVEALVSAGVDADLAIVSVPERQHFEILSALRRGVPRLARILCEKPLAASAQEAWELARQFADTEISVNFVERFSPVVGDLLGFMRRQQRRVLRANCFWGKYRIKDARPTPGVISVELAHPLDLIMMLADVRPQTPFRVRSAVGSRSDFDVGGDGRFPLDTVHAGLEFESGVQVMMSSSLLWAERERRIELTLGDEDGVATEMAVLCFDQPIWDLDRLDLYDLRRQGGRPAHIERFETAAASWPADRLTIAKVCRFLEANLDELFGIHSDLMPRLTHSAHVQQVMETIEIAAGANAMLMSCYAEPRESGAASPSAQVEFLSRVARGVSVDDREYIWDHPY